jgi:glycosyltransferase involved in cell wall biosynthesis
MTRRLCMVVHGPYPIGEPRVAREVSAALAAGWEVDVIATRRADEPLRETVDGARVMRLRLIHRRGANAAAVITEYLGFTLLVALKVAREHGRRSYDIVHVHSPPDFLIASAAFARLRGARVILDIHDLSPDMFAMRFGERRGGHIAERVLRRVERIATRLADRVVTVHEPYRRELAARGTPADKIVVVMNSLDEALLPDAAVTDETSTRVVYHGTVTSHYGLDLVIEALASLRNELPDITLEIYGEGDDAKPLQRLANSLQLGNRVRFSAGYLGHREVLKLVSGATIGVVPNRSTPLNKYALSSKLMEYVALGIPAVVSDLPTLREHFDDNEVAYFTPGDSRSLASTLQATLRDPLAAARRTEAARQRYEAYRWPLQAERYVSLLADLARR